MRNISLEWCDLESDFCVHESSVFIKQVLDCLAHRWKMMSRQKCWTLWGLTVQFLWLHSWESKDIVWWTEEMAVVWLHSLSVWSQQEYKSCRDHCCLVLGSNRVTYGQNYSSVVPAVFWLKQENCRVMAYLRMVADSLKKLWKVSEMPQEFKSYSHKSQGEGTGRACDCLHKSRLLLIFDAGICLLCAILWPLLQIA